MTLGAIFLMALAQTAPVAPVAPLRHCGDLCLLAQHGPWELPRIGGRMPQNAEAAFDGYSACLKLSLAKSPLTATMSDEDLDNTLQAVFDDCADARKSLAIKFREIIIRSGAKATPKQIQFTTDIARALICVKVVLSSLSGQIGKNRVREYAEGVTRDFPLIDKWVK